MLQNNITEGNRILILLQLYFIFNKNGYGRIWLNLFSWLYLINISRIWNFAHMILVDMAWSD